MALQRERADHETKRSKAAKPSSVSPLIHHGEIQNKAPQCLRLVIFKTKPRVQGQPKSVAKYLQMVRSFSVALNFVGRSNAEIVKSS